ncbi:glycoside hydrolase TIM-barrel-like domain-containing protein [Ruegeria pomeroyi]|uniref:baseplate multidomain protein megatron n=1 Tax=Ruegeria pomeroyi TaxID=89184 RepID=UPI001F38899A|nr:glycoside hydrolase TIM-barrel-like domain-containing protein [Ruegeria pomeroyi]MCE8508436.1 glycoside hydrolase TIM-barrel-like domain-containing protein [Ruegeria pomeroyi]
MATLVLGAAGAAIGGSIGGAILGVSAATIGGFVGSTIGSFVDSWIVSSLAPTQRIEGPRLDSLRITSSTEGAVIPRVYGRMRMGGNVIWATDFREETKTTTQGGGKGGGGGGKVKTTEYLYYASFAVALCEGPITGIGRIWADGKLLDTAGITWRWYPGDEAQPADPFIAAKMGAANTPAYRGTAYVVFEELPLGNYGNRLPQLSFEVFRPLADPDTAEGLTRAVTMIPASGEFTYATQAIRKTDGGATAPENLNALADSTDMVEALDRLQAMAPAVESVSLVVAWFGDDRAAQVRTPITDGAAGKPWVFRYKDLRSWWSNPHYNRPGGVESGTPTAWVPQSKPIRFTELGCPAIDRGTNQPNVFFDPKSSESFTPYFSRGWRDDTIQRAYLEATYLWWGEAANNPLSSAYGGRMVHVPECAAWTWDARPYPFFPELTDVWTDGPNWRLGHWLTGRLGVVSLAALVRHLCLRAGLPEDRIDITGLWGAVEGYAITALESPRASITTLARHFGFDAVETEGVTRFAMRGRAAVASVTPDDLVAAREGDVLELTRGQETELPQALKWQVARADEDYDAALVEARRITVDTTRIASESFPMAVPPEEAERRCRRALMEAWVGRETAAFRLPPSRLALDPADAIRLEHNGRLVDLRLVSIADAEARGIEAVRQDRATYDLPPGDPRAASLTRAVVFGAPEAVLMDLPQLTEDQPAHRPLVAAHAVPWPGEMAVFRSPSTDGFDLLTSFGSRARIGALVSDFYPGPTSRFDLGNALVVDLLTGTLESVTDLTLFGGANALAIKSTSGTWEIVQAGAVELLAPGRYRLTRLLRGQRGTEGAMGNPAPAGVRVVVLDTALASLPIAEADLGIPWNWRIGPASRPVSDETYVGPTFTPEGVGLRPFSVAHVEQPWRRPRTPGDLTIRWTRRSRALAADSWGAVEVPLVEEVEAYEVEILDGATVKRVLTASTTSAIYTAAQQTADWGAPLAPGDTLTIRIYQLSALIGRGAAKTVTLTF